MCKDETTLKRISLLLTALLFFVGVAILTLSSIEFKLIYATWSESLYSSLGPTQITAGTIIVVTSIIGLLVFFSKDNSFIYNIYSLILIITMIFSYAIGIFAIVAAAMKGKITKAIGCDTKSTGLLNLWTGIDDYFKLAHSLVCSPMCPCPLSSSLKEEYESNRFAYSFLDQINSEYDVTNTSYNEFNIENCPNNAQLLIQNMYNNNPNTTMKNIDFSKFNKYFKRVEKRFECSGWCTTSYTNIFNLKKQKMYKYVFSDFNKGVPNYPGCLMRILSFLYIFSSILGAFLLLCGVLCTISLINIFFLSNISERINGRTKQDEIEV